MDNVGRNAIKRKRSEIDPNEHANGGKHFDFENYLNIPTYCSKVQ